MSRVLGDLSYNVDVMDYHNKNVKLSRNYDMVIDLHPGANDVYRDCMAPRCVRIAYITGSNPAFSNRAETQRLEALFSRKGVRIGPVRHVEPFKKEAIESCDMVMFMGNSHNLQTFREFHLKKVFLVANTGYEFLRHDDLSQKNPRHFLFLGGKGQVHKGLDLLLELFSQHAELTLYVCSQYNGEPDFCRLYGKELFRCPNIVPVGFVNIAGRKFRNIAKTCSYMILPSCSEGKAGSVLTAMSAGLLPIVTRECGFEDDEVFHLGGASLDDIERAVIDFSRKGMDWIIDNSRRSMEVIRTRYGLKHYEDSVRRALQGVLPEQER